MEIMNLTVKRKLLLSFLSIIFLLVLVMGVTYYQFLKVDSEYGDLIEDRSTKIQLVTELYKNASSEIIALRGYLANGNDTNLDRMEESREDFRTNMDAFKSVTFGEDILTLSDALIKAEEEYNFAAVKMIEFKQQNDTEKYTQIMNGEGAAAIEALTSLSEELLLSQQTRMTTASEQLTKKTKVTINTILIISVISILIGVAVALLIARIISRPIQLVSQAAEEIAEGNLTIKEIKIKNRDEIGLLATSFNKMVESLRNIIQDVHISSEQVASSSEELMAGSAQTSEATNQVVLSIQEVAAKIEVQGRNTEESANAIGEITIGVQRIAESTGTVAESAVETTNQANIGNQYIQDVVERMNMIYSTSSDTTSVMKELEKRTTEIGKIIGVITDIADQTNLLALNAAIESARAGEHGRGFAVVADEVRKLAEQSRTSANQIAEIIQKVQSDTAKAVEMTSEGNEVAKTGLDLAEETGRTFGQILKSIEDVNAQTQELSAISEEISASIEQVNASIEEVARLATTSTNNVSEIASASEEQLATLEEVSSSASSLAEMAEHLRESVNKFKL